MKSIWKYIESDFIRYGYKPSFIKILFFALTARNHCFAYNFWLRLIQRKNFFYYIAKIMHWRLSRKYGILIPGSCKIGYGFYIGHGVGIIINGKTVIGDNCNISQFLTIGSNYNTPAVIGNNVYIGPNVCIVEDVEISDNVTIGAGSVVVKNIPENATVAGVPAKILNYNNPGRFVNRRYITD